MKITKFFVAALASLAMFSCSNDEEMTNASKHQNTALSVSVANIMNGSRAVGDLAADGKVWVNGTATLTIKYTVDGKDHTAIADLTFEEGQCKAIECKGDAEDNNKGNMTASADAKDRTVTIWNVGTVHEVTVSINGGEKNIADGTSIADYVHKDPKAIPAYAEQKTFELSGKQDVFDDKDGNGAAVPDYKNYYFYEVTLKPENTEFARIELSDIYFVQPTDSKFKSIKLEDVVLDEAIEKKGSSEKFIHNFAASTIQWGLYHDKVTSDNELVGTSENSGLPKVKDGVKQSFGYNMWAGQMPKLRLHFSAENADDKPVVAPNQWAYVTKYLKADGVTPMTADDFKAGVIYRIKHAKIEEKNITPDPDGNKQYAITVTVEPAEWAVTDISVEWNETETPKN